MDARRECVRLVRCVYIGTGLCSGQTFGVTFAYIYPHVWSAPSRGFHALRGPVQMRDRTVVAGDGGGSTRKTCCQEDCVLMACLKPSGDAVRTVCMHAALHLSERARSAEAQTRLHASANFETLVALLPTSAVDLLEPALCTMETSIAVCKWRGWFRRTRMVAGPFGSASFLLRPFVSGYCPLPTLPLST